MLAPGRAKSIDSVAADVECRTKIDRETRMHIMADLSFSLHLSQCNGELYGPPCYNICYYMTDVLVCDSRPRTQ